MGKVFLGAVIGAFVGVMAALFWQAGSIRLVPLTMSYADLAATVLSAVAVLLAILGFFIAVLAVMGWAQFRGLTRKAAAEAARDHINERLNSGDLRTHFKDMTAEFLKTQFNSKSFQSLVEERIDHFAFSSMNRSSDEEGDENEE